MQGPFILGSVQGSFIPGSETAPILSYSVSGFTIGMPRENPNRPPPADQISVILRPGFQLLKIARLHAQSWREDWQIATHHLIPDEIGIAAHRRH